MNLRGGSFERQVRDAFFRTLAYGEGRNMQDDNLTHSVAVADKRMMYLQDFKDWIENKGIEQGKLNQMMTEENIKDFLDARIENLSPKAGLDYVSGFNSLMKGLEQVNITIPADPLHNDFLQNFREVFREEMKQIEYETGRYIDNMEQKLDELKEIRYESYTIAKLQSETGFRVNEAMEVTKNFEKYYNEKTGKLEGVIGKGNHEYAPKTISNQLALEIKKMTDIPSYKTYTRDLKKVDIERSHNFRVTYAKDLLEHKLEDGKEYKQALKEVSEEINHHRPQMTEYYLARA